MKAKSFYKNNKHNNMDSKEKENINEEELKAQDAQDETCEETTEKEEEVALTEEEKLAQELETLRLKTRKTSTCVSLPSSTTTVNVR